MFVVDASITLWRRGGADARRRAAVVGGSVVACIVAVAGLAALITLGLVHAPTIVMPGVFLVVLAMGYELGWDMLAAAQLAARLRTSELRFRAVVEAVPSAILLVDDKGLITLANAQAEAVFGYPRAEFVATPVDRLIPDRFRGPHAGLRGAYARDPRPRAMGAGRELFACRRDGSEFPVEVALSPMSTDQGLFVLASVVDITERRHIERATARQRDELAHLSRVAMLGELSGSLAHELNQPLTAILSNAQAAQRFLAQSPPRIDKLAEILSDIVKSDHRARRGDSAAAVHAQEGRGPASVARHQRRGRGVAAADAQRPAEPPCHGRHRLRRCAAGRQRRSQPAAAGVAQPHDERLRRHGRPGRTAGCGCERNGRRTATSRSPSPTAAPVSRRRTSSGYSSPS